MSARTVGLLHPGAMGSTIGRTILSGGHRVLWAADGRSRATRERAELEGFEEVRTLADLCAESDAIVSVCPPHGAAQLAEAVAGTGYRGIYVDANAIPPAIAGRIRDLIMAAGGDYVDGSIIGPPAYESGSTRVYLSGTGAESVAELFVSGAADAVVLDGFFAAASALKMVYAAFTKGSAALLLAVVGAAGALGVDEALHRGVGDVHPGSAGEKRSPPRAIGAEGLAIRSRDAVHFRDIRESRTTRRIPLCGS